jgi:hypothetical protein
MGGRSPSSAIDDGSGNLVDVLLKRAGCQPLSRWGEVAPKARVRGPVVNELPGRQGIAFVVIALSSSERVEGGTE